MSDFSLNRRHFLKMMGSSALMAGLPAALTPSPAQAAFGDYRALVCVFLFGGNDGFNMLIPRSQAEYNIYAASRQNMAIDRNDLLAINPIDGNGVDFGLHPSLAALETHFETGDAAFLANIGPLLEPTDKTQYFDKSVDLPPQLFSHNDQQDQWHSLKGRVTTTTGWGGRLADALRPETLTQKIPTTNSLFGTTLFLSGGEVTPYVMGPDGPLEYVGLGKTGIFNDQRQSFERILQARYESIYTRAFADIQQRALDNAELVNAALDNGQTVNTAFPDSQLGQQLKTVARLIGARNELQMERQVFFVAKGGFDTHDDQVAQQPDLLADVADCLDAFYRATDELSVADKVTTFTQSDFGRTLTSNGDGTDHAWGSVQLVLGGSVDGQKIYGDYPLLDIDGDLDIGGGRLIPQLSADQYAATLARWMGASEQSITNIAPNIGNFATQDFGLLI